MLISHGELVETADGVPGNTLISRQDMGMVSEAKPRVWMKVQCVGDSKQKTNHDPE
jgi:hypothetical protein